MMGSEEDGATRAAREIAEAISEFRNEYVEYLAKGIVEEKDQVVEAGYDPTRGRGRGPWWADGG